MEKLDPVVFKLGAALYICQIFESSLMLLHMLIDDEEVEGNNVVRVGDDYSKKTLGRLLNLLKHRIEVPKKSLDFIFEAIQLRNQVIHGYMTSRENVEKFESKEGRQSLVADLDSKLKKIRERDLFVCSIIDRYLEKYGTSTEKLKRIAGKKSKLFSNDQ